MHFKFYFFQTTGGFFFHRLQWSSEFLPAMQKVPGLIPSNLLLGFTRNGICVKTAKPYVVTPDEGTIVKWVCWLYTILLADVNRYLQQKTWIVFVVLFKGELCHVQFMITTNNTLLTNGQCVFSEVSTLVTTIQKQREALRKKKES